MYFRVENVVTLIGGKLLCISPYLQWSFGVTCWEVFNVGRIPYPGVNPFSLIKFLEEGKRLDKPSNAACSDEMWVWQYLHSVLHSYNFYSYNTLMLNCWSESVDERPEFSNLVKQISIILEAVAGYMDFTNIPRVWLLLSYRVREGVSYTSNSVCIVLTLRFSDWSNSCSLYRLSLMRRVDLGMTILIQTLIRETLPSARMRRWKLNWETDDMYFIIP